jgi:hypothetical protein
VPASHNDACRNGGNPSPDLNEPACNTAVERAMLETCGSSSGDGDASGRTFPVVE